MTGLALAQELPPADGAAERQAVVALMGDPVRGKVVFTPCEDCHRKDASGRANGVFPRLAGQHASVIIKQVLDIRAGRRHNPSMQPLVAAAVLSDADLVHVATYLQGLPVGSSNGKGSGSDLAWGKQLYERDCVGCHGARGEGEAARFYPAVAAQHYRTLLREMVTIRDGERRNSNAEMVKLIQPYSQRDLEAVADHMSRLVAKP